MAAWSKGMLELYPDGFTPPPPRPKKRRGASIPPCVHRGPTKGTVKASCCGTVEVFDCAKLECEVWATKCRSCKEYAEPKIKRAVVMAWGDKKAATRHVLTSLPKLGYTVEKIQRGDGEWKDHTIQSLRANPPDLYIGWQRLHPGWGKEVKAVLDELKIPQLYMDFGVWPHYESTIFDTRGDNADSTVPGNLDAFELTPEMSWLADKEADNLASMRRGIELGAQRVDGDRASYGVDDLPDDFILTVLQKTGDSVTKHDAAPPWTKPQDVMKRAIVEATAAKQFTVIKTHPFDTKLKVVNERSDYHRVFHAPHVDNEGLLAWMIVHCKHVILVNSTVTFTAMAAGKPVVTLGHGWYSGNGVTAENLTMKQAMVATITVDAGRIERFLLHMLSRCRYTDTLKDPDVLREVLNHHLSLGV